MFRGWFSIRNQLLLLAALATGSIWTGALLQYWQLKSQSLRLDGVQYDIQAAQSLSEAARQVARERGLTNGWLLAAEAKPTSHLASTRAELDAALVRASGLVSEIEDSGISSRLLDLQRYRQLVDRREMSPADLFDWYSQLIEALLNRADSRMAAGMIEVGLPYEHVNHIARATENLARLRGLTNGILTMGAMDTPTRAALGRGLLLHREYLALYERRAPTAALARSIPSLNQLALRNSLDVVRRLLANESVATIGLSPVAWWTEATVAVDDLQRVSLDDAIRVTQAAQQKVESLRRQMWLSVATLLVLGIITLALVLSTVGRIVKGISALLQSLDDVVQRRTLKTVLDDSRSDEFGQISRGVNQLVAMAAGVADEHERHSLTDALTGLLNRRGLEQQITARLNPDRRQQLPLCLVMLDIDHFKSVNDTLGHPAGDAVLAQLAYLLRQQVRPDDVVARFGGEEFILLLPGCQQEEAAAVAEKVRVAIETYDFGIGRAVTISLGAASHSGAGGLEAWLARADAALYVAKSEGRNRVRLAPRA